jgi:hypothetical protein
MAPTPMKNANLAGCGRVEVKGLDLPAVTLRTGATN